MQSISRPIAALLWCGILSSLAFGAVPLKQYPSDMRLVDITKAPYEAPNDGSADVSDIILSVFETEKHDWTRPLGLYFPAGTYLVSKTILYGTCCTHIVGQGQGHTIIRLGEGSLGFDDPSQPKGVLRTSASLANDTKNNVAFRNYIQDLTISVGPNNPGAVGIEFISSNTGAVKNVEIVAEDGSGYAGLAMEIGWPGPLLVKNLSVEGFDYGIRVGWNEYSQTYEHISLRGQAKAAILNNGNMMAIRGLTTDSRAPAIVNLKPRAMVILLDGRLENGAADTAAIVNGGYLYARNVSVSGYGTGVVTGTKQTPGPLIEEHCSHRHYSLFGDEPQTLHLPVEETPEFHDNTIGNWVHANAHATVAAMETAMRDASKTTLYWNIGAVTRTGTLRVPPNIRKIYSIDGLINVVNGYSGDPLIIRVDEESPYPLILEGLTMGQVVLEQRCNRTVAVVHCKGPKMPTNFEGSGKLFIEDAMVHVNGVYPQKVWARQLNAETGNSGGVPQDMLFNHGGDMWLLGIKTEGRGTVVTNTNGGRLEVLGTFVYPVRSDAGLPEPKSAFINTESSMSLIYKFYGGYTYQVHETRDGTTRTLASGDVSNGLMTLYTGIRPQDATVRGGAPAATPAAEPAVRIAHTPGQTKTLRFTLSRAALVDVRITNSAGRLSAAPVVAQRYAPGTHAFTVDTRTLANGLYCVQLRIDGRPHQSRWVMP